MYALQEVRKSVMALRRARGKVPLVGEAQETMAAQRGMRVLQGVQTMAKLQRIPTTTPSTFGGTRSRCSSRGTEATTSAGCT